MQKKVKKLEFITTSQQPRGLASLPTCFLCASVVSSYPSLGARQTGASDDINPFIAPSKIDNSIRGPCPGLNILANHGYIPRNGRNISATAAIEAQMAAFNFDQASAASPITGALSVSTTGYSDTFNLDDLARPGADRDGDLSRADRYFGDNISFNQTIWSSVMQHWPDETVTFAQAAEARAARLRDAAAENPEFSQPEAAVNGSFTQLAGVLCAFGGSAADGWARRDWINASFVEERLPYELGWTAPAEVFTAADLGSVIAGLRAATPA